MTKYINKAANQMLDLSPNAYVQAIKAALKLTVYVGNNVFNVDDRHDTAKRYMQLISYLLNVCAIGESQVAQ